MEIQEIHLSEIGSTNTYAKENTFSFDPKKITCISAEAQTAGRGRFERRWVSPKGVNLYVTFYFQLPINTLHLMSLGQVMAYSFASLLIQENMKPKIKWPNDILLDGKKAAGILCEMRYFEKTAEIFLGIGINVNMDKETLATIDQPATSLKEASGRSWDKKTLLKKLQVQFLSDLETFKKSGFTPFHSQFENLLAFKGQTVLCFDGKTEWVGVCHSLTNDGQLNLIMPDKKIHTVFSGEVKRGNLNQDKSEPLR